MFSVVQSDFINRKKMKRNDFYVTVKIVFNFCTVSTILNLAFLLLEFIYLEFFILNFFI